MMPDEPVATEGSATEYSLLRPRAAAAAVSGCASELYSPRPRVTRTEDSRHREYEVPHWSHCPSTTVSLHSHHPSLPLPGTKGGLGGLAVLRIA